MKGSVTDGQLGQLAVKQHELFERVKRGAYASVEAVLDALQLVIEGKEPIVPVLATGDKPAVLSLVNPSVGYAATDDSNPAEYYQTRPGLWVSGDFERLVRSKASRVSVAAATGKSYDLTKPANDRTIEDELGEGHQFESESELCAYLAQMIDKQPNGSESDLQNNGYWNLFYLRGCVVGVRWGAGDREWDVYAWQLVGVEWGAGSRAFSRN